MRWAIAQSTCIGTLVQNTTTWASVMSMAMAMMANQKEVLRALWLNDAVTQEVLQSTLS